MQLISIPLLIVYWSLKYSPLSSQHNYQSPHGLQPKLHERVRGCLPGRALLLLGRWSQCEKCAGSICRSPRDVSSQLTISCMLLVARYT
ncbi:hypothetical protein DPMN_100780 [Dreissena polymorpha]|uniref:Secreted protein n=1 Tax=Dreissena polymorpha TaxID=45954 RepID=A0A9D4LHJ0_DREPO|nr:hypothetical protein DPMN_100780 [Dreissena polymorpha]